MTRTIRVASLAISVFAVVSFTAVLLMTREPAPAAAPPPVAATPAPQAAPPAAEEIPSAAPPTRIAPRRDEAKRPPWSASVRAPSPFPPADRVVRKAVRRALSDAALQTRLARCVDRDIGFGSAPGNVPRGRPATLLLDLEAREHDVRIVGVGVERWGGASDDTVSCAREVLRGTVIATSPREAGVTVRMPFPLNPRMETLAARR